MTARCTLLIAIALGLPGAARAQQARTDSVAFAGAAGIYVWLGGTVVSPARPVNGTVAHRVERRRAGATAWERVDDVAAPSEARGFFSQLDSLTRRALRAFKRQPTDEALWAYIGRFPRADSLAVFVGNEPARRALGLYALDRNVRPGERWQYRVSRVDAQGRATEPITSGVVDFPARVTLDTVRTVRADGGDHDVLLAWDMGRARTVRSLAIWRRQGTTAPFRLIDSVLTFFRQGDSIQMLYRDAAVTPGQVYQYYAVPRDFFFNPGASSDTATAYSVDNRWLAVPDSLVARPDSGGVLLTWRLRTTGLARAIRIYRSARSDSGWYRLSEVPGDARRFVDERVEPLTVYYYRLAVLGLTGEEAPLTAVVFSYYRSPRPPLPPAAVRVDLAPAGARVAWQRNGESDVRGYYVYRADEPYDSTTRLTLVSPLLRAADSAWVDSGRFDPLRQYTYVVRALNTSNLMSERSNPGAAPPDLGAAELPAPEPPMGLSAIAVAAAVRLAWNDDQSELPIAGYEVLRRTTPRAGVRVADTVYRALGAVLERGENAAWDSSALPGVTYEYAVRALGLSGRQSPLSVPARASVSVARPGAPAGVHAGAVPDGIQVTWGPIGVAGRVRVYRYERGGAPRSIGEVPADAGAYLDATAVAARRYYYAVALIVDGVESGRSDPVTARR
jgi:hypothetical protein